MIIVMIYLVVFNFLREFGGIEVVIGLIWMDYILMVFMLFLLMELIGIFLGGYYLLKCIVMKVKMKV